MNNSFLSAIAAVLMLVSGSHADLAQVDGDTVIIETLGFNTNGVAFDSPNETNAFGEMYNGAVPTGGNVAGHPIDVSLSYGNMSLDNDGIADDTVTFNLNITSPNGPGLLFGQGFHTNWGTIEGMVVSVTSVSGTTTGGRSIVFDGFTGAAVGAGNDVGNIDRSVDLNGSISYALSGANSGVFEFVQQSQDFAPVAALNFTNSGGTSGTFVARNFDMQFSAVPEPSSLALVGLFGVVIGLRRRK